MPRRALAADTTTGRPASRRNGWLQKRELAGSPVPTANALEPYASERLKLRTEERATLLQQRLLARPELEDDHWGQSAKPAGSAAGSARWLPCRAPWPLPTDGKRRVNWYGQASTSPAPTTARRAQTEHDDRGEIASELVIRCGRSANRGAEGRANLTVRSDLPPRLPRQVSQQRCSQQQTPPRAPTERPTTLEEMNLPGARSGCISGGGGIRTLDGPKRPITVFETAAFNHSATPPDGRA